MSKWERLSELLLQKLEIFRKIQELCEKQSRLIAEDRFDKLEGSISEVQEQREKINGLHQDLDMLMQSYVTEYEQSKDESIDLMILEIKQIIEECARLNEQNMNVVKQKTLEHTKKIDEQSAKRKGIVGYAQPVPPPAEMMDRKS